MRYNLTDIQRYDTSTLQSELDIAAISASINGHGATSFDVITDNEAGADVVVQLHINKGDAQHDIDIDAAEVESILKTSIDVNRNLIKALALYYRDEINILRNEIELLKGDSSLPNITGAQVRAGVKSKL